MAFGLQPDRSLKTMHSLCSMDHMTRENLLCHDPMYLCVWLLLLTVCISLLPVLQEWVQDVYPSLPERRRFGVQDSPLSLLCADERRV